MANSNNVQNVKFLRNGSLFTSRDAAKEAMEAQKASLADGVAILGRYSGETAADVKTLVGFAYISGETKTLTVFDVEGASADVNALREEINAKLGNITSANTVYDQLVALSGAVEGAKSYASGYTDEKINGLDYTGVTTGDGKVIVNVTEADGVISANTAEVGGLKLTDYQKGSDATAVTGTDTINQAISKLENQVDAANAAIGTAISGLDKPDSAEAKKFVTSVSETDGVINVSRGEITSSGGTIVLSDNSSGDVNFEVHIDGISILKNESGELSVANSALIQYSGDGETINVSEAVGGVKTISSPLTIQKVDTGLSEEVREQYQLVGTSGVAIGDPVKIYKDSHIVSISYIKNPADPNYQNLEYVYIDASGNTKTTYIDMSELVLEAEFESGVTITNHVAHGVVDPTSENFLTVDADGFKLSGVQDAIDTAVGTAVSGLDATVTAETANQHISISIEETDGKLVQSGLTITESNIASADALAELSGKTVTAITSTNSSITASINDAVGNKTYDIETDASKIKMTGFTADTSGFTGITTASTVTEAVKAIETAFIDNEEVVSAALNDLNTKVNTISGDVTAISANVNTISGNVNTISGDVTAISANVNTISGNVNTISGKVDTISGDVDTIKANYISGVSVNGKAVTVDNKVAPISISAATSATSASATEAITVTTDNSGNITLGLSTIDCGIYD